MVKKSTLLSTLTFKEQRLVKGCEGMGKKGTPLKENMKKIEAVRGGLRS